MGKFTKLEERGRVLIPKTLREELGLRVGERLMMERRNKSIVLKPARVENILTQLRGCIKTPSKKIKPSEVKKIWEKCH